MNPGVLAAIAKVESYHWWYRGLRATLAHVLANARPPLPPHPRILDVGCGTGENLRLLADLLRPAYLGGLDISAEALEFAARRAPEADLYLGDLCDPVLRVPELDLVLSCDVLYIPGVERARAGLQRLADHLAPGGLLVLNLPAYRWLRSEHDRAIHTRERYTAGGVRALLGGLGLLPELVSYRVCLLFPAVALARLLRKRGRRGEQARTDLERIRPGALNDLLYATLRWESRLLAHGRSLPWGSSVFALGRKPLQG
jgi:SAM-dependent methyltransferase